MAHLLLLINQHMKSAVILLFQKIKENQNGKSKHLPLIIALFGLVSAAQATVVTFDNLPGDGFPVPNGYAG